MSNILKEKPTTKTIIPSLESARSYPTGRLWVDYLIKPTMIVNRFVRSWHDGDFLLEQQCLKEIFSYFFASGHHNYAIYVTYGTCVRWQIFHTVPRSICLIERTSVVMQMVEHKCHQTSLVNRPTVSRGNVQVDLRVFPQIQAKWQCGLTPSAFVPMYL